MIGRMRRQEKMKVNSKKVTMSATTLATVVFFAGMVPVARAADYCITNGAQAAHGCGYPSMEMCEAAASGIGGSCAAAASSTNPNNALGYAPKQPGARSQAHFRKKPVSH